jgi:hypothetical protein
MKYHLTHRDRDWIDVDVVWDAIEKPSVLAHGDPPLASHWEQFGHITGTLTLLGEALPVDCLALRDRTWGLRGERWNDGGDRPYSSAAVSSDLNFLATTGERFGGYLTIDGERRDITGGRRSAERHPDHGYVTRVEVHATDTAGRELHAVGNSVSRMAMPLPGLAAVVWTSTMEWTVNGEHCWGEDQDPWPLLRWSQLRRAGGAGTAVQPSV